MAEQNFTVDTGLTVTGSGGNITGANNIVAANTISVSGNAGDITMTGGNITGFNTLVGDTANVTLTANTQSWTFDTAGVLNLPGEGILQSANDTVTLQSYNTSTNYANGVYVGTSGGLGFFDNSIPANWLEIFRNSGDPEIKAPLGNLLITSATGTGGAAGKDITITAGAADQTDYYATAGGAVNIVGGRGASNDGGGGGPGGDVNITSGISADPAGHSGNVTINSESSTWTFDYTGNLTLPSNTFAVNYANGTPVSIGGGGGSYSDSNVATFLAAYGSNTVSTTGNITSGNLIATANVLASGYARLAGTFDEAQASTAALYLGYAGGTPRIMFGTGNTNQTLEIDNDAGTLRFYKPGTTLASLTNSGVFSAAGNVVGANIVTAGLISATGNITGGNILTSGNVNLTANTANVVFSTGAYITGNTSREGSILLSPYTGAGSSFPGVMIGGAGRLLAPNGSVHQIFNTSDVTFQVATKITVGTSATSTTNGALIVTGGIGVSGNVIAGGNTTTGIGAFVGGATNTLLSNTVAGFTGNVNNYTQVTFQNKNTGTDATADFILTSDNGNDSVNYSDFGIINSGYDNSTPTNSLGNIVYAADTYIYAQGNVANTSQSGGNLAIGTTTAGKTVKIFAGGVDNSAVVANISNTGVSVTGNVTASNFIGNISITGNVTGTSANVTLVAGSYSTIFDNTGLATFPGNVSVVGNVITPNRPAFRVYGSVGTNIPSGTTITSTQGATVDYNTGSYYNNSTGLFTAPVAGIYSATATLRCGSTSGLNQASIQKNSNATNPNVVAFWEVTGSTTVGHMAMAGQIKLAVGDTLRLQVLSGNVNFDPNDSWAVTFLG